MRPHYRGLPFCVKKYKCFIDEIYIYIYIFLFYRKLIWFMKEKYVFQCLYFIEIYVHCTFPPFLLLVLVIGPYTKAVNAATSL